MNEDDKKKTSPKEVNPNLQDLRDLPPEKRKEIASAGGKASVEARRSQRTFKNIVAEILSFQAPEKVAKKIVSNFPEMDEKDVDNKLALVYSQYAKALKGDNKAFKIIYEISGEAKDENDDFDDTPLEIRIVE